LGETDVSNCFGRLASLLLDGWSNWMSTCVATNIPAAVDGASPDQANFFCGSKAGDEREVGGVKLCWCPAGRFIMGSPGDEPERRPDEAQVEVTLTKGLLDGQVSRRRRGSGNGSLESCRAS